VIGHDTIEYASMTDVGIRRSHNQDAHASLLAGDSEQWQERGHLFLVADGMGAHAVGELASKLAVTIIPHTYHKHASEGGVAALRKAFVEANASIHAKGQQNPEFAGMGTTTTALLLRPEGAWMAHVGDSRGYRVRDGEVEQLTFDHSLVWEMARRQGVDPDTLQDIPSNVIVRSLGPEPLVEVDIEGPHAIKSGDIYVLCSDGLSGQLSDAEIGAIASSLPPAEACRFLVDMANLRGGPDNITVVIIHVHEREEVRVEPEPRVSWYRRVPLWVWFLLTGVLLAGDAAGLWFYGVRMKDYGAGWLKNYGVAWFLLAAVAIAGGLLGLVIFYRQEQRRLAAQPTYARPRIYRQVTCRVERSLVDKLAKAVSALKDQIQEKRWDVDWANYHLYHTTADRLMSEGNLVEGFREYCRAMRLLAEAVQRQHPKGEEFQPVWLE
jgi:protein phosphatase